MNCINHPETSVSAFCQHCGKPLCAQCVRPVQGVIYCEECLAAKLSGAPGFAAGYGNPVSGGAGYTVNVGASGSNFQYSQSGPLPNDGFPDRGPNPVLAGFLGFIPGVGAMYNGQFIKALVHVLVFVVLISLSHTNHIFGIFIGTWVLYQVFDGYQTAKARRDGLPLPDPFGLNELGNRMSHSHSSSRSWTPPPAAPGASAFTDQGIGMGPATGFGQAGFTSQPGVAQPGPPYAQYPPYTPVPPDPSVPPFAAPFAPPGTPPDLPPFVPRRSEPIGAIILIGLGLLFLFWTTGFLGGEWIAHGWPLVLIGVGAWMVIKRLNELKK